MKWLGADMVKELQEIILEEEGVSLSEEEARKAAEAEVRLWTIILKSEKDELKGEKVS